MADRVLERVTLPDGNEMVLEKWNKHVAIKVGKRTLMSSHEHGSEDELGRLVADRLNGLPAPRVLIGGLGLGFTLRAALDVLPPSAKVTVAELVPAVVRWNEGALGVWAKRPLDDPRVTVAMKDVAKLIASRKRYDAILLDVDNGPDALTHADNKFLYQRAGLVRTHKALARGGLLAVWSGFPSRTFVTWLREVFGNVETLRATPTTPGGPRYWIWIARRA